MVDESRRVGRPSLQAQRRQEIIDAFIELVAVQGLESTSLDEVAAKAGIKRPAMRHFIGNRDQLIAAAVEQITHNALAGLEAPLALPQVIATLFDPARMESFDVSERAWWELLPEAIRAADTRAAVKQSYDRLNEVIAAALRQDHPDATPAQIADTAYAIACMAEYNYLFQRLGYPRSRCTGVQESALALAAQLR